MEIQKPTIADFTNSTHTHANAAGGGQIAISTGISGLGTNVGTFLATPSSANLAAALTDETGSGSAVFATLPTLVTPVLGVASATSLAVDGTAGAGFVTLLGQSANPTPPAAGTLLLHSSTANGFTRMEQDNEATTNLIYGRDSVFIAKNTSGGTITKGSVVYVTGSTGNVPNIAKAQANSSTTLAGVGVLIDDIANNAFGQVMILGVISNFDTSAFSAGAAVFISTTVAGELTATRPSGTTNFVQRIGIVLVSGVGNGSLLVEIATSILNMETGTNAATWTGSAIAGTSLATSAATPLVMTNGQAVNVAVTSQTVGATTLTIPDFASVADEFTFKTKAQTMSNKTFIAPALGTPASGVLTNCTGTATGLTSGITNALKSATTTVDVSAATAPTVGQVLTATSGTAATWQAGGGGVADVQIFTSSGTWTKPAGKTFTQIIASGSGAGAGSGRRGAAGTIRCGGGGGGGGGTGVGVFQTALLSATETVTIGAAGTGGAAVTANDTDGNSGTAGGDATFGGWTKGGGGNLGAGGTASTGTGGLTPIQGGQLVSKITNEGRGGNVSPSGGVGSQGVDSVGLATAAGGGAGGGITSADSPSSGGAGGAAALNGATTLSKTGGTAGTAGGAGGAGNAQTANTPAGGSGGGGGAGSITAAAGAGGAGAIYGGGGGGGGASLNGNNSGAGGAGALGIVIVISW